MADPRVSFPVLEDSGTQAGLPLHKVLQGDALAAKNALAALAFKNAGGTLRYPLVDADDHLIVTTENGDEACLSDRAEDAAGSATLVDLSSISLIVATEYKNIGYIVSCFRDAIYQLIWDDDGAETILADIEVGSGQYTSSGQLECLSFTSGATGTQTLKFVAKNLNALSALRSTLTVSEVQP